LVTRHLSLVNLQSTGSSIDNRRWSILKELIRAALALTPLLSAQTAGQAIQILLPLFRGDNAETLLFRQASIEKMGHFLKKISPSQLFEVFSCAQIISGNRQNSIMKDGIFGLGLWHFFHLLRYYPPCWKPKTLGTEIAGEWGMVERELPPSRNKNVCRVARRSPRMCAWGSAGFRPPKPAGGYYGIFVECCHPLSGTRFATWGKEKQQVRGRRTLYLHTDHGLIRGGPVKLGLTWRDLQGALEEENRRKW
jgi:hypothetical protein